ncbi:MAG: hypothetical protein BWY69_01087 [Planctomycetes bacterium ADurb.Bin401]|nr:MAG: hypothetical protein BWY69_01087 [Planctomycetes bacterium ADurb.Bin401]
MDGKHSKGLQKRTIAILGIILFLWQIDTSGAIIASYGATLNKSLGLPNQKDIWIDTFIFVPIKGKILDLNLAMKVSHTSFCDLEIMIEHPSGISATISSYDKDTFIPFRKCNGWVVLDEQSSKSIDSTASLINTSYKPNSVEPLSSLNGLNSYGLWTIKLADTIFHDSGIINNLRLDLRVETLPVQSFFVIPEPASLLLCVTGIFIFKIRK